MIQFLTNKKARCHWKFIPTTKTTLKKYGSYKPQDIEKLFWRFENKAILDQEKFLSKKGIKLVLCHIGNEYVLTNCQKNYDGTYHGQFFICDDTTAKNDLTAIMNAWVKNINKFQNAAAGALLKKEDVPYNVLKGMN